jgi:hypothetical protein
MLSIIEGEGFLEIKVKGRLSLGLNKYHVMNACGEVEV